MTAVAVRVKTGFTLIELVVVIMLIAVISALTVGNFDTVLAWKQKGDIRQFISTWEFLYNEALGRGEGYRLYIDLDENSYYVRREVQVEGTVVRNVDHLKNLRTKGEKERRAKREEEELLSLDEEFNEDDRRQSDPLEKLYYNFVFGDPEGPIRLATPLEFPSLAKPKELTTGLIFRDVRIIKNKVSEGQVAIRFSPKGASEFAVVHFAAGEQVFTAMMNPSSGEVSLYDGDKEFEWILGKKKAQGN